MMKINQDRIYRWTLRSRYLWAFLTGAVITALGTSAILGYEKISEREELNIFISLTAILIGIILIIVGFYIKKDVENYILKLKL